MRNYLTLIVTFCLTLLLSSCSDTNNTSNTGSAAQANTMPHGSSAPQNNTPASKNAIVDISNDWVRATHAGQTVGAAYMTLTSQKALNLIAVNTDVSDATEIHSMRMDDGVMKMRQLKTLSLAPNEAVELSPGGFHFMLFDLAKPLVAGEKVTFDLLFESENGQRESVQLVTTIKEDNDEDAHAHHHH